MVLPAAWDAYSHSLPTGEIQKNAASPTHSLDANDMKATSRNNARSPFLPWQALSNESVPMGGALVRLMQMAGPNEQALTIRKSPPTLFVRLSLPGNPFSPLAHSARLPLCPLTQALCPNLLTASFHVILFIKRHLKHRPPFINLRIEE